MKKEFIEYQEHFSKLPNDSTDICAYLLEIRDKYLKENQNKQILILSTRNILEFLYNMKCPNIIC